MGLCGSGMTEAERQEFERSKMLEQQNREDHLVEQEKIKLLLLGEYFSKNLVFVASLCTFQTACEPFNRVLRVSHN